jgi:CDP-glucose 4,6-dehydratase
MQDWRGTRVLVTGHTGFKGSWLCEWLLAAGAEVTGFALEPNTEPNLFSILRLRERMASHIGDVRDVEAVNGVLSRTRPEVVFHLAAQALVLASIDDPVGTFATNVMGTVHVLDAVRRTPSVEAVVVVTSDKCYENSSSDRPFRESDPMGGKDPYSSSKGCAELATSAFRRTYFSAGAHIATARAGNVIGGGDWSLDRIIPDIARAIAAGNKPLLRFPKAVRPWQHVLDAIAGYVLLAEGLREREDRSTAWNFGPDESSIRTVAEVTEGFMTAWGVPPAYRVETPDAEFEARTLRLESSLARGTLGWSPALPFDEAIAWTARWYREWNDGGDLKALTDAQLSRYGQLRAVPSA